LTTKLPSENCWGRCPDELKVVCNSTMRQLEGSRARAPQIADIVAAVAHMNYDEQKRQMASLASAMGVQLSMLPFGAAAGSSLDQPGRLKSS